MNLNVNGVGRSIAIIKDNKKLGNMTFSVAEEELEDNGINKGFEKLHIDDGQFQVIPDKNRDRDTIFICGSAGSGKSYWTGQYIKEYNRIYKKNPVYLISEGSKDPAFDVLKFIKRVKLDDDLINEPIEYTEFENCCVIFDDIDAITGKLGKYIYNLRDKLLKNSRKNKVSVITTNHTCTGLDLKAVLNESDTIVFFLKNYNRSLKYLLEQYVGLNKDGITNLRKNKSRWTAFIKSYPNVIVQEKDIMCINSIQNF
jgi:hypothetical protein